MASTSVNRFIDRAQIHETNKAAIYKTRYMWKINSRKINNTLKCFKTLNFLVQPTLSSSYAPQ